MYLRAHTRGYGTIDGIYIHVDDPRSAMPWARGSQKEAMDDNTPLVRTDGCFSLL